MGRAASGVGSMLMPVHQRRHAIDQRHAHTHQQQLRDGVRKGHPFVHLRHQVGHRDVKEAAGGDPQHIGHPALRLLKHEVPYYAAHG
ncbi:hypothetical protein G6F57_017660 [Rhizopus arrhizus]|nr:hypothetical protein G6F57_017660 [Rhizopus arrhizus]